MACFVATLGLIGLGGVVTSKGAGMAVPDWPTSYGYNMFWLPLSWWKGGIFYEHTHRLYAAFIGLLTTVLAGWLWCRETKGRQRWAGLGTLLVFVMMLGHRGSGHASGGSDGIPFHFKLLAGIVPVCLIFAVCRAASTRGSLRWLGMTAFFAVILQGLLGGFRVALYKDEIGIFHATLAQCFLALLAVIALLTSRCRHEANGARQELPVHQAWMVTGLTVLVLGQLVVGAAMRHQHAGLAVPDFPLAHGQLWPATDAASLELYNQKRTDVRDFNVITAGQIHLHMIHRMMALVILASAIVVWRSVRDVRAGAGSLWKGSNVWLALIVGQAMLGVLTVWSNKAADIATMHVVMGALTLSCGVCMSVAAWRMVAQPGLLSVSEAEKSIAHDVRTAIQSV